VRVSRFEKTCDPRRASAGWRDALSQRERGFDSASREVIYYGILLTTVREVFP